MCVSATQAPYIYLVKSRLIRVFQIGIDDVICVFHLLFKHKAKHTLVVQSRKKVIKSIHRV